VEISEQGSKKLNDASNVWVREIIILTYEVQPEEKQPRLYKCITLIFEFCVPCGKVALFIAGM